MFIHLLRCRIIERSSTYNRGTSQKAHPKWTTHSVRFAWRTAQLSPAPLPCWGHLRQRAGGQSHLTHSRFRRQCRTSHTVLKVTEWPCGCSMLVACRLFPPWSPAAQNRRRGPPTCPQPGTASKFRIPSTVSVECIQLRHHHKVKELLSQAPSVRGCRTRTNFQGKAGGRARRGAGRGEAHCLPRLSPALPRPPHTLPWFLDHRSAEPCCPVSLEPCSSCHVAQARSSQASAVGSTPCSCPLTPAAQQASQAQSPRH